MYGNVTVANLKPYIVIFYFITFNTQILGYIQFETLN